MTGNVWEWTSTKFNNQEYICVGGSWAENENLAKVGNVKYYQPYFSRLSLGFRLVLPD